MESRAFIGAEFEIMPKASGERSGDLLGKEPR
jgi:hypothetical protein